MTDTKKSELDILFPDRQITVGAEEITVGPLKFTQWGPAAKMLGPTLAALNSSGILAVSENGKGIVVAADWFMRLPDLVDDECESLYKFVAYAVGKPRAWLDTLEADEGLALAKKIIEVNGDFFVKRIAPMLGLAVQEQPAEPEAGEAS